MKKIIAFLLVMALSFALVAVCYADTADQLRKIFITDGIEFDTKVTDYYMSYLLSEEKQKIMEEVNDKLFVEIPETDGCYSIYWPEYDPEDGSDTITITLSIYNFDLIDHYRFRYYEDHEFVEVEPDINYEERLVSVTIPKDVPFIISCIYGDLNEVKILFDSITGDMKGFVSRGGKSGALPFVIKCPANLIPFEFFNQLSPEDWEICYVGVESVESQIPDDMILRYLFWGEYSYYDETEKVEKEDYDLIYRMDDVFKGEKVVVKCYDGEWELQECEVKEDFIASAHIYKTGLVAIFTEDKSDKE